MVGPEVVILTRATVQTRRGYFVHHPAARVVVIATAESNLMDTAAVVHPGHLEIYARRVHRGTNPP